MHRTLQLRGVSVLFVAAGDWIKLVSNGWSIEVQVTPDELRALAAGLVAAADEREPASKGGGGS